MRWHIWALTHFGHVSQMLNLYTIFQLSLILKLAGKDWGQEEKGMTEDEIVGWHHRLNGHGFGWTLGVGDGQGDLACCSSWGHKESDMTEQLNWILKFVSGITGFLLISTWTGFKNSIFRLQIKMKFMIMLRSYHGMWEVLKYFLKKRCFKKDLWKWYFWSCHCFDPVI